MVGWYRTIEELKSLSINGIPLESKLAFETHLWEIVSKSTISLVAGRLFACPRVLESSFNACVFVQLRVLCLHVKVVVKVSFEPAE